MKKNKIKNTIVVICFIAFIGLGYHLFKENIRQEEMSEHSSELFDLVKNETKETEDQLQAWSDYYTGTDGIDFVSRYFGDTSVGNSLRTLYDDYVTTADEMKNILEENGIRINKINNWDSIYQILQKEEDRGTKIRYSVPNFNDETIMTRYAIVQLDAIDKANEVAEITLNFDSFYQFLADASGDSESIVVPYSASVYSGDEYKKDFEKENFYTVVENFKNENPENGVAEAYLYELNKENIINTNFELVEHGHIIANCERVADDGQSLVSFKIHFDCNTGSSACLLAFDEDYQSKKEKIEKFANKYSIEMKTKSGN